jgi:hypothetical protein
MKQVEQVEQAGHHEQPKQRNIETPERLTLLRGDQHRPFAFPPGLD